MVKPNAVLLLSGGLDSTTLLAFAISEGYAVHTISFRYGQRHTSEIEAARASARRFGAVRHEVASIDLSTFGGSALTSNDIAVPKDRPIPSSGEKVEKGEIPVTYVPARNTIFLSYALAYAEVIGANDIFIGVNSLDYSGYPDCRPEFIESFQTMANLATRAGVEGTTPLRIRTPFQQFTKKDIIALGLSLGVDYSQTISCYDPVPGREDSIDLACGHCDACQLRLKGFTELGIRDPAKYAVDSQR